MDYKFYKEKVGDTIFWVENNDCVGEHLFTFDKKKDFQPICRLPLKPTKEEKAIFDRENPEWADFFKDRQ